MSAIDAQRRMTAALIADDPTTVTLIPRIETTTPAGGKSVTDGVPRQPVAVKLSLLNFDERPTVTTAGVERLVDYHLIGPWDMPAEVDDYWTDAQGTRYEIVAFSEGWDYMTKAMVSRHVPKLARP